MGGLSVVLLSLGEDVVIEELDEPFEGDELDNGVGNLTTPQRTNTLVESTGAFGLGQMAEGSPELSWIFSSWP